MVKVLEVNNLNYQDFKNINLSFYNQKLYLIVGGNNSGKTTLFKLLSGIILTNDCINCNGITLNEDTCFKYIKNIGVVPKLDSSIFIYQNVLNEMLFPLHNLHYSKRTAMQRINYILNLFHKEYFKDRKINELCYSDQVLLLLIIALLHGPKIVLIDDFLPIFDKKEQEMIINVLLKLIKQDNISIVFFSSGLNIAKYCDKLLLLSNYQMVGEYAFNDLFKNDKSFYDNNIEIPFIVDLVVKLKMYGLINKEYTTIKEMVDDLWQ